MISQEEKLQYSISFDENWDNVNLSWFRSALVAYSGCRIAIAVEKAAFICDEFFNVLNSHFSVALDFEEELGYTTAMIWLNDSMLCVSFECGYILCFNLDGRCVCRHRYHCSAIRSLKLSNKDIPALGNCLWILHEDGHLIAIMIEQLLSEAPNHNLVQFRLLNHNDSCDFSFLPIIFSNSIFDAGQHNGGYESIAVVGMCPALSVYTLGAKQQFQTMEKLASYVKEKVTTAIAKTVGSAFTNFFGFGGNADEPSPPTSSNSLNTLGTASGENIDEVENVTVSSIVEFQDTKRKMMRLSTDPTGKLIAAADALGRVTLFDTRIMTSIRMWKGLRDARFAWSVDATPSDSVDDRAHLCSNNRRTLSLSIYAPQLGILSQWAMKHGPCLRVIPVGQQCQIFTIYTPASEEYEHEIGEEGVRFSVPRCALIRGVTATMPDGNMASSEDLECPSSDTTGLSVEPTHLDFELIDKEKDFFISENEDNEDAFHDCESSPHPGHEVQQRKPRLKQHIEIVVLNPFDTDDTLFQDVVIADEPTPGSEDKKPLECITESSSVNGEKKKRKSLINWGPGRQFDDECKYTDEDDSDTDDEPTDAGFQSAMDSSVRRTSRAPVGSTTSVVSDSVIARDTQSVHAVHRLLESFAESAFLSHTQMETENQLERLIKPMKSVHAVMQCAALVDTCDRRRERGAVGFSFSFHTWLVKVLIEVASLSGDVKLTVECLMRRRLLNAHETLCKLLTQINAAKSAVVVGDDDWSDLSVGTSNASSSDTPMTPSHSSHRPAVTPTSTTTSSRQSSSLTSAQSMKLMSQIGSTADISAISKGQTYRSEAFCWSTRTYLKNHTHPASSTRKRNLTPNASLRSLASATSSPIAASFSGSKSNVNSRTALNFSTFLAFFSLQWTTAAPAAKGKKALLPLQGGECCRILFRCDDVLALMHAPTTAVSATDGAATPISPGPNTNRTRSSTTRSVRSVSCVSGASMASTNIAGSVTGSVDVLGSSPAIDMEVDPIGTIGNDEVWSAPVWAAHDILSMIFGGIVHTNDSFLVSDFDSLLDQIGLGNVWSYGKVLPLLECYLELVVSVADTMSNLLLNKHIATCPFQKWMRDGLLGFPDVLGEDKDDDDVDLDMSTKAVVRVKDEENAQKFNYVLDVELVEYCNEKNSIITSRNDFTENLQQHLLRQRNESNSDVVEKDGNKELLSFDLDDAIRFAFRPLVQFIKKSPQLEKMMSLSALIIEVMITVCEHIERKSYGKMTFTNTIESWKLLFRQLRICLLFSSRRRPWSIKASTSSMTLTPGSKPSCPPAVNPLVTSPVTVYMLSHCGQQYDQQEKRSLLNENIYGILAEDTLGFAIEAEMAMEHEIRCQGVFTQRSLATSGASPLPPVVGTPAKSSNSLPPAVGTPSKGSNPLPPLTAWGEVSDARWREFLHVAEVEDFLEENGTSGAGLVPSTGGSSPRKPMSSPDVQGVAAGAVSPAAVPAKKRRRRPLLLFFPLHNQPSSLGLHRSLLLAGRWAVSPQQLSLFTLTVNHLYQLPPLTRAAVAQDIAHRCLLPVIKGYLQLEENKSIVTSSANISSHLPNVTIDDNENTSKFVQSALELLTISDLPVPGPTTAAAIQPAAPVSSQASVVVSSEHSSPLAYTSLDMAESDAFVEDMNHSCTANCWPPYADYGLSSLVKQFQRNEGSSTLLVRCHSSILLVLLLRLQCGLRGILPSELFHGHLLSYACQERNGIASNSEIHSALIRCCDEEGLTDLSTERNVAEMYSKVSGDVGKQRSHTDLDSMDTVIRKQNEFILQCFRLFQGQQQATLVYRLTDLWRKSADSARLMHIQALLEAQKDDIAGEIISQMTNPVDAVDAVIAGLRLRIGTCVARFQHIPSYGALLIALDAEAVSWVRGAVNGSQMSLDVDTLLIIDAISSGKRKAIDFDVPNTRYLVLRVQNILTAMPTVPGTGGAAPGRDANWVMRKGRCDALLSLCGSLTHFY